MLKKQTSKMNGSGIFSTVFIRRNCSFYEIPLETLYKTPKSKCARIGERMFVCDPKILNWVNHSCNPNSKIELFPPLLQSIREILPNEEITVDYNKTELPNKKVKCNCGEKNCRGYFYIT